MRDNQKEDGLGHRNTGTPDLLSALDEGVLMLTLNRPEARNAMSDPMLEAIDRELAFAQSSREVRCVVLQGNGRAFCAGGDVKAMGDNPITPSSLDDRIEYQRVIQRATSGRLVAMGKPSLAVIHGPAAGAGLALALACDLRIMARPAFLLTAFANVALSGDFGIGYLLARLVGMARAKELMFLPERVASERALDLGLTNWVCEAEELEAQAALIAGRLASAPPQALAYMKEHLNSALSTEFRAYMDHEVRCHIDCSQTADHVEGVRAFAEKRAPVFSGD
ncbi:enoyl-CoA hydratase [Sphingobium fuliginis ATCC 27551]|uniref:Enoyl-CoA hydratase n=1 Tax=Sphingobium fuliginis ATCC 27551 TaxID=1208342 RepID=A0A5B8CJ24_SPHSA|nr:enoyl-CoA hydratase [Sphingobium fuliginis ATCC 27551]